MTCLPPSGHVRTCLADMGRRGDGNTAELGTWNPRGSGSLGGRDGKLSK